MGYDNYFKLRVKGNPPAEKSIDSVIEEFVSNSEEANYLLDIDGSTNEGGSEYGINSELRKFSKRYPDLTFILTCRWESGFVEEGKPGTDYFFFKDGIEKQALVELRYFDPFNGEAF